MEYLINMLETFAITKNETVFNYSINNLTDFYKLNITDSNEEWKYLKNNYSNLRYIHELMNHYNYNLNKNFYDLLSLFMESIDKSTQEYIKNTLTTTKILNKNLYKTKTLHSNYSIYNN